MSKRKYLKVPMPKWTWWQTIMAIVSIILAFRINMGDELIDLLKELVRLLSG